MIRLLVTAIAISALSACGGAPSATTGPAVEPEEGCVGIFGDAVPRGIQRGRKARTDMRVTYAKAIATTNSYVYAMAGVFSAKRITNQHGVWVFDTRKKHQRIYSANAAAKRFTKWPDVSQSDLRISQRHLVQAASACFGQMPAHTTWEESNPLNIQVLRQNGLILLVKAPPRVSLGGASGSVGVGSGFKLATLPNGCVVDDLEPRAEPYRVLLWPAGTTVDSQGSIQAVFEDGRPQKLRIGQELSGGSSIGRWTARTLHLPKEVTAACPGSRYVEIDDAKVLHR